MPSLGIASVYKHGAYKALQCADGDLSADGSPRLCVTHLDLLPLRKPRCGLPQLRYELRRRRRRGSLSLIGRDRGNVGEDLNLLVQRFAAGHRLLSR